MSPWLFCTKFNSQQLLFEQLFNITGRCMSPPPRPPYAPKRNRMLHHASCDKCGLRGVTITILTKTTISALEIVVQRRLCILPTCLNIGTVHDKLPENSSRWCDKGISRNSSVFQDNLCTCDLQTWTVLSDNSDLPSLHSLAFLVSSKIKIILNFSF